MGGDEARERRGTEREREKRDGKIESGRERKRGVGEVGIG